MSKPGGLAALALGVEKSKEVGGSSRKEAASDVLDAINDGDAKSLSLALMRFVGECTCKGCDTDEDTDSDEDY